ncbi:MAG TPA: TraX family protein [Clostridia bacterium]|nr:TraX family protein [Clostridia bacterium]
MDSPHTTYARPGEMMSGTFLKIIAIMAMLTDHIAWAFVPTHSLLGQLMHVVGRLTAPIMCFFIAEGYHHTRNVKRYALRLGLFALISHAPYIYFESGRPPIYYENGIKIIYGTSVIYTLLLGLILLMIWNDERIKERVKHLLAILIVVASAPGDWSFFAVLWIWAFGVHHGNIKKQLQSFSLIAILPVTFSIILFSQGVWWGQLFQLGVYLAIPFIYLYNGKLGYKKGWVWIKWVFYAFYPLHLLVLGLLKYIGR